MIGVIIFEDVAEIRELLSQLVQTSDEMCLLGAFHDAKDAVRMTKKLRPDVILMDIQMPGTSGIEAARLIKVAYPDVQILMQTVFEDNDKIFAAICAGASGYVLKGASATRYLEGIIEVHQGGSYMSPSVARKVLAMFKNTQQSPKEYSELTATERKVLDCLVKGMSYKLIAEACEISFSTVNFHLKNIYRKLHVNSATEAILQAMKRQLV